MSKSVSQLASSRAALASQLGPPIKYLLSDNLNIKYVMSVFISITLF